MGKCSYTWEEWNEKSELVERQCSEETWEDSDEYCIFHDPSPKKDVELFKEKLEKQMKSYTNKYNFIGYYFPGHCDFSGQKFEIDANFREATFQGRASFSWVEFQDAASFSWVRFQNANFKETTFQGTAYFRGATFQNASFMGATFQNASFEKATFQNADFRGATFQGTAVFSLATFQNDAYFCGATFENADFMRATFQNASFEEATFQNADFKEATFQKYVNLWEATFQKYVNLRDLEIIYRKLKQKMQRDGNYSQAGEFYYQEMEMKRQSSFSVANRLWLDFYRFLAGYGEKPLRTLLSSLLTIAIFTFFYWFLECLKYPQDIFTVFEKFVCSTYFSFVTFTTLGLGDIHPVNNLGRMLVCVEAVIGAFLIALFVVVFTRKMMR